MASASRRRGISLIEVLVSMFILLFGLLGVAAMFPAGQFHVERAARYDRGSAIGQRAFNEIKIRGLVRSPAENSYQRDPTAGSAIVAADYPLLFDPLGRVTVPGATKVVLNGMSSSTAADIVMQGRDDLEIGVPIDVDTPSTSSTTKGYRQFDGHYSWFFLIAPPSGTSALPTLANDSVRYRVSVAVAYKRNTEAGNEVSTTVSVSGGIGGGNVTFSGLSESSRDVIKPGNWILLTNGQNSTNTASFHQWYKIVAVDPNLATPANPSATVVGPNWPFTSSATAVLFDSVIAVYERQMSVGGNSAWER